MSSSSEVYLVTGATGAQGGATVRRLLAAGCGVRFLTRRADSAAARELIRLGAKVFQGDFDDPPSLDPALRGINGVFSVQLPDFSSSDSERRQGFALIGAARKASVPHFVHSSVSCAGRHEHFPRWSGGYWTRSYWTDKWDVEEAVRSAGFERWTVLRPAFLMENFSRPKVAHMFPHLAHGELATALHTSTRMQLICSDDVGSFTLAALQDPKRYAGQNIELAAEALTMSQIAKVLTEVTGAKVVASSLSPEQAIARGMAAGWVRSQEWSNEVGYCADIETVRSYGIPLTSFASWAKCHRHAIPLNEPGS